MRSRWLRDSDDEEIVVTVGDWQSVEVRDRVSSKDSVWNVESHRRTVSGTWSRRIVSGTRIFVEGLCLERRAPAGLYQRNRSAWRHHTVAGLRGLWSSAQGRRRHRRRRWCYAHVSANNDDVTLNGKQVVVTSQTARTQRRRVTAAQVGEADGVRRTAAAEAGSRRMTSWIGRAARNSGATASRDIRRSCHTVDRASSTGTLTSPPWLPPKSTPSYNRTSGSHTRLSTTANSIFSRTTVHSESSSQQSRSAQNAVSRKLRLATGPVHPYSHSHGLSWRRTRRI